jgi:Leucine-rich repeat (LRR) protein
MVFKNAMTSDFKKIIDLSLSEEKITKIDVYNSTIKNLAPNLRKLDLSSNYLVAIENLD